MSSCVIIELSDSEAWPPRHGCKVIPPGKGPTILHPSREIAEAEAVRLVDANPARRFVVFEAVAAGITVRVPTHVTLGGKVVAERSGAELVRIDDDEDDGIPF